MVAEFDVLHCDKCGREFGPISVAEWAREWLDARKITWIDDGQLPGRIYLTQCGNCWVPIDNSELRKVEWYACRA